MKHLVESIFLFCLLAGQAATAEDCAELNKKIVAWINKASSCAKEPKTGKAEPKGSTSTPIRCELVKGFYLHNLSLPNGVYEHLAADTKGVVILGVPTQGGNLSDKIAQGVKDALKKEYSGTTCHDDGGSQDENSYIGVEKGAK